MTFFSVGLLGGAATSGLVVWLASGLTTPIPWPWRVALVLLVAVVAVLRDVGLVRIRLPQNARQIPQEVLRDHLVRGALQFGFELGTGVRTYVSASAPYALAAAVLLVGQPFSVAMLAAVGFGIGRALTPLLRYASQAGERWDALMQRRLSTVTVLCSAALAVAFGLLLW